MMAFCGGDSAMLRSEHPSEFVSLQFLCWSETFTAGSNLHELELHPGSGSMISLSL